MIWDILVMLSYPDDWCITVKNGEVFIEHRTALQDAGARIKG